MSLRQQAAARREIRELKAKLSGAKKIAESRTLSRWEVGQRIRDEVATAAKLGFDVHADIVGDALLITAVKRVYADA